jgi:transcriptional regulator with XRE-family HTH domain
VNADEIRNLIAAEVKRRSLTQKQLADMTKLEQANISRFLLREAKAVSSTAFVLLDTLGLELIVQPKPTAEPGAESEVR